MTSSQRERPASQQPQPELQPEPQSPTTPSSSSRFPFPFRPPPLSQPQPDSSSVSLVPSTAQGRPIPLTDTNAADRTTALRELSRSQPITRRPYAKAPGSPPSTAGTTTGTTTGTYSQPVLVRTYSGPISPSTQARSSRPPSRPVAVSGVQRSPNAPSSRGSRRRHGFAVTLIRPLVTKRPSLVDDAKLPPLEDFSFKNIMAEIGPDIGDDLDRIADICARSRYSLSNQYEIHVTPHGSGASFIHGDPASTSTNSLLHDTGGPTLQAISIGDEHPSTNGGRRALVRRKSAAYGTLETIMSSSRSSDEDRGKRKSAAEITAQVRGRILHPSTEGSGSAHSTEAQASGEHHRERVKKPLTARHTLAAAILDHSRILSHRHPVPVSPRASGSNLVSEPALPETSHSHLLSMTTPEGLSREAGNAGPSAKEQTSVSVSTSVAAAAIALPEEPKDQPGLLSGFRFGIPWKATSVTNVASEEQKTVRTKSYAEGTLRHILRITESTGNRGGKPTNDQSGVAG
ncbi:hypothetical protein SAMD00023353_0600020 [Rosellinia necatrix]|uniref:Uncharacterized protein n=1 Tax=Rosellinia necatrix TaxID=77044 RepID=A0A1S7UPH5_ROSNE|nr:hypothetical protein SAMD00023353_0600020 [Rosellinia necatrix]